MKERLGEFMLRKGYITVDQLEAALTHQRRMGGRLGTVLWRLKILDEKVIIRALGEFFHCAYVILQGRRLPREVVNLIKPATAKQIKVLPLKLEVGEDGRKILYLATRNPDDMPRIEHIRLLTGCEVRPVVVLDPDLEEAIEMNYSEELATRPEPLTLEGDLPSPATGPAYYTDSSELEPHDVASKSRMKILEDDEFTLHLDPDIDTRIYLTYLLKLLIKRGVITKDDIKGLLIEV